MSKISIVIPLYNKKDYFERCIISILSNTIKDVKIIIVNDGSTDGSEKIAEKYATQNPNIFLYNNENHGLSYSRNFGISKVETEYFLLVDSDDYIENKLIENLEEIINHKQLDIISFRMGKVDEKGDEVAIVAKPAIGEMPGPKTLENFILSSQTYVTAPGYLYNTNFFRKNDFKYALNRYHEDFGLTPWILLNAKTVISIDYVGYYYVQSENSIMRGSDYKKNKKMAYDILFFFDDLYNKVKDKKIEEKIKKLFVTHISHTLLSKINTLNEKDKRKFIYEIRRRKLYFKLSSSSLKKIIKNILIFINPKYYFKVVK